ncbi:hypothetical protein [Caldisalinibacter kiritimatiensis]|uniref:DUF7852 domain-containing protein n=1 Tax=Caldisalinibacter kiritimatiensis TaxID=1304284 RepID=R1CWV1_9FIRM|nr:hypothetical protein [Caldisalinibacter kiritimatiensis]EOD01104.1 hypothetical protein L21TH_0815 [Caldisalinibacter kiritimatiensis]
MKNKKQLKIDSKVLGKCENNPVDIETISGYTEAKVPVILAEFSTQFNLSFSLNLSYEVSSIKNIDNKLLITQCMLIPGTEVVYIKGILKEHMDYYSYHPSNIIGAKGSTRHCTIKIPFEFTTNIVFNIQPPNLPIKSTSSEIKYLNNLSFSKNNCIKNTYLTCASENKNKIDIQYYNNFPYCEIVNSEITQNNIHTINNVTSSINKPLGIKENKKIEKNMSILLGIRILQDRYIEIYSSSNT